MFEMIYCPALLSWFQSCLVIGPHINCELRSGSYSTHPLPHVKWFTAANRSIEYGCARCYCLWLYFLHCSVIPLSLGMENRQKEGRKRWDCGCYGIFYYGTGSAWFGYDRSVRFLDSSSLVKYHIMKICKYFNIKYESFSCMVYTSIKNL